MDENTGHGEQGAQPAGGAGARANSRRPAITPTVDEMLEIVTEALVRANELGQQEGKFTVNRFVKDGWPCVQFRGCQVRAGKLVIDM